MQVQNVKDRFSDQIQFQTIDDLQCIWEFENRIVFIGEIEHAMAVNIYSNIYFWNKQDEEQNIPMEERVPIKIFINSPGGYMSACFTIIDAIKSSKTPIYTINTGDAYSCAFFIFIHGHKRFSHNYSSFLYHEGSVQSGGDASKFFNFAEFYQRQLKQLKDMTLKNSKIPEELYEQKRKDDWWLTTDEGIKYGFIDYIIECMEDIK